MLDTKKRPASQGLSLFCYNSKALNHLTASRRINFRCSTYHFRRYHRSCPGKCMRKYWHRLYMLHHKPGLLYRKYNHRPHRPSDNRHHNSKADHNHKRRSHRCMSKGRGNFRSRDIPRCKLSYRKPLSCWVGCLGTQNRRIRRRSGCSHLDHN